MSTPRQRKEEDKDKKIEEESSEYADPELQKEPNKYPKDYWAPWYRGDATPPPTTESTSWESPIKNWDEDNPENNRYSSHDEYGNPVKDHPRNLARAKKGAQKEKKKEPKAKPIELDGEDHRLMNQ